MNLECPNCKIKLALYADLIARVHIKPNDTDVREDGKIINDVLFLLEDVAGIEVLCCHCWQVIDDSFFITKNDEGAWMVEAYP